MPATHIKKNLYKFKNGRYATKNEKGMFKIISKTEAEKIISSKPKK